MLLLLGQSLLSDERVLVYSKYVSFVISFRTNKLLYGLPDNSLDETASKLRNWSSGPFSISITLQYAGHAENSINPRVWQTYLFARHTTLPVLAATLELSE